MTDQLDQLKEVEFYFYVLEEKKKTGEFFLNSSFLGRRSLK